MELLSLFAKLKELERIGILELRKADPSHIMKEDGRWFFQGNPIEIKADFVGPSPDGSGIKFKESDPHDLAWCPVSKTVIAFAPSNLGPLKLIPKHLREKLHKSFKRRGVTK